MKRRALVWLVAIVAGLSLIAAGCGQSQPTPAAVQKGPAWAPTLPPLAQETVVKVGMKQVVSDGGILIGMAKGYYKDLGIKIEPIQFNTGQEMINALAAGQLDVGATVTASGLFNAMSRDLKGRKIAIVGTASLDEIALDRVLGKGGMTTKDVDLQVIRSFPDMLVSLGNKSIDAAMVIEPFVTVGMAKGIVDPWKDPVEYDPDAQTALLVYGTSMTTRPDVANRFMTAYVKSLRDYNDAFFKNKGKAEIIDILCKYSVVKEAAMYEKMFPVGLNPDGYLRMKGIEMDLAWYKQRNLLKTDIKLQDAVDHKYADFAVQVLGKY